MDRMRTHLRQVSGLSKAGDDDNAEQNLEEVLRPMLALHLRIGADFEKACKNAVGKLFQAAVCAFRYLPAGPELLCYCITTAAGRQQYFASDQCAAQREKECVVAHSFAVSSSVSGIGVVNLHPH